MNPTNRRVWMLEKYSRQIDDQWQQIDKRTSALCLRLQEAVLFITGDAVVLESLALTSNPGIISGILKRESLFISVRRQGTATRKFRVRFARDEISGDRLQPAAECANALREYFPIDDMTQLSIQGNAALPQMTTLPAMFQKLIEMQNDGHGSAVALFPAGGAELLGSSLEDAVRLCLLDPSFPDFVNSVGRCLESITTASAKSS